jgi:hypothetical protein
MVEKKRKVLMLMQFIKSITNSIPDLLCFMALFVATNCICNAFRSSLVNSTKSISRTSLTAFTECQNNSNICVGITTGIMEDVAGGRRRLSAIDLCGVGFESFQVFCKTLCFLS